MYWNMINLGTFFESKAIYLCFSKLVGMKRLLLITLLCGHMGLFAQDIHFSQFYMSPLNLNPALTGVMNCKMRVVANYRNQWAPILGSKSFNTYNLSFDQKIPVGRYDYFGFGGTFWGDKAGSLDFATIQFKLSGSYSKRMAGSRTSSHYLVFGGEAGLNQRSVNFQNAVWGTQITKDGPVPGTNSGEPLDIDQGFLFADVSVGLLWFSVLDKKNNYYIGGAFSHLNEPLQNHYRKGNGFVASPLYSKLTVHAGGDFAIDRKNSILPGIVSFFQGPHWQLNAGTSFRFNMSKSKYDEQAFQLGLWARLANKESFVEQTTDKKGGVLMDALILSTRFDYHKYGIGLSYDINTSRLRKASGANNAFELSFIYNICSPEHRGIYCPNF